MYKTDDLENMKPGEVKLVMYKPESRKKHGYDEIIKGSPKLLILKGVPIRVEASSRPDLNLSRETTATFLPTKLEKQIRIRIQFGQNLSKG